MSRIDDLIAEYSPNGVELKSLGDLGEFIRGNGLQKKDLVGEGFPAIHYGQIHTHYGVWAHSTKSFTSNETASKLRQAKPGDLLIATTSEDDEAVAKATAWVGDTNVAMSGDAYIYRHSLDPRYVSYFFRTEQFQAQKRPYVSGTKVRRVSGSSLAKVRIPVPPLEVQREIVRMLDQFTQLEAELEAELAARLKQRDALSSNFEVALRDSKLDGVRTTTLGELCAEVVKPVAIEPDRSYVSLGVKWNGEGVLVRDPKPGREIRAKVLHRARPGQLMYNRMFVVEGSFAIVPQDAGEAVVSGEFPLFDINENKIDPYWLINFLCSSYTLSRIEREVTGTERGTMKSRRRWKSDQFAAFTLQLPPLEEQKRTVRVLRLCDDLIGSLRAELTARTKQSTYYRDKLLTFKEVIV